MAKTSTSIEDLLKSKAQASATNGQTSNQTADADAAFKLKSKLAAIQTGDEEAKIKQKASSLGLPYIDLTEFPISAEALRTVPENICAEQKIICFMAAGDELRFATTNPENIEIPKITHSIEESQNAHSALYLTSERNLTNALNQYAKLPKYKASISGVEITDAELQKFKEIATDFKALEEQVQKVNITDLVTLIVAASLQSGSSDIHVEAEEKDVKIRFRVDGILHDAASIKKEQWPKVISRIKLLSGLKINITDKPQDGRFSISSTKEKIDVRVSCLPTAWGESVVMRLLKSSTASLSFEDLGLIGKAYADLKVQCERPNGMIIATGPTGSGKTTTLYAILNKLNKEGVKVITLEDPVEYKLEGVNQSQIDHSRGYSFADGLRSMLRQDPDVVMVGEMRDLETADVAINAALTGHLVISTIHTNSASGAIPRFLAMDVKPFLLSPALNAIIGQRLVRKICEKCKKEIQLEEKTLERVKQILSEIPAGHPDRPKLDDLKFYQGAGCEICHNIGYKGRVGVYEIMILTPEIEKYILDAKVSEHDLQQMAIRNNMLTMVQDGLIKALNGATSVEEVFRVSE
ncbi:MAG: GspE/PulE family protein [Patescibacteria group bacterium]